MEFPAPLRLVVQDQHCWLSSWDNIASRWKMAELSYPKIKRMNYCIKGLEKAAQMQ